MDGNPKLRGFSRKQLKAALVGLRAVLSGDVEDKRFGLCSNLNDRTYCDVSGHQIVSAFATGWPLAKLYEDGTLKTYFVPDDEDKGGDPYFKWVGRGLELRTSLIEYIIGEIEKALEK